MELLLGQTMKGSPCLSSRWAEQLLTSSKSIMVLAQLLPTCQHLQSHRSLQHTGTNAHCMCSTTGVDPTHIFNVSLLLLIVPSCFKSLTSLLVLKMIKVACLNDWRPVALTSIISKCFEWYPLQFAYCQKSSHSWWQNYGYILYTMHSPIWRWLWSRISTEALMCTPPYMPGSLTSWQDNGRCAPLSSAINKGVPCVRGILSYWQIQQFSTMSNTQKSDNVWFSHLNVGTLQTSFWRDQVISQELPHFWSQVWDGNNTSIYRQWMSKRALESLVEEVLWVFRKKRECNSFIHECKHHSEQPFLTNNNFSH